MNGAPPTDGPVQVTVRCIRCARDLGTSSPAFVACVWSGTRWSVIDLRRESRVRYDRRAASREALLERRPELRRASEALAAYRTTKYPAAPDRSGSRTQGGVLDGRGFEVRCRRCNYRPRVSRRRLYDLAEQAVAAGRRDAYL